MQVFSPPLIENPRRPLPAARWLCCLLPASLTGQESSTEGEGPGSVLFWAERPSIFRASLPVDYLLPQKNPAGLAGTFWETNTVRAFISCRSAGLGLGLEVFAFSVSQPVNLPQSGLGNRQDAML